MITINEVQKMIEKLEAAGELSMKEEKYLALAKAFKQLAAENVALKQYALDCVDAVGNWNAWADKEDQIHMAEKSSLERLQEINADNQRRVTVSVGVLKAARREIQAHVKLNGKGIMTDMVLNSLNAIIEGANQ